MVATATKAELEQLYDETRDAERRLQGLRDEVEELMRQARLAGRIIDKALDRGPVALSPHRDPESPW